MTAFSFPTTAKELCAAVRANSGWDATLTYKDRTMVITLVPYTDAQYRFTYEICTATNLMLVTLDTKDYVSVDLCTIALTIETYQPIVNLFLVLLPPTTIHLPSDR